MEYTCPCCGYKTFTGKPGSYEICPICFWEDDLSQLRFVKETGANKINLVDAQKNYEKYGVSKLTRLNEVRKDMNNFIKDVNWRLIDLLIDKIEEPIHGKDYGNSYPEDLTKLYYWSDKFLRN